MRSLEQIWLKCLDTSHGAGGKGAKSKDANGIEHHEVTQETNQVLVEIGGSLNKSKKRNANANREYYTNLRNSQTQWTKPYYPKIFRAQDIELDVFVSIVLRSDVFAHR